MNTLTWLCDACTEPVADNTGYLGVDTRRAQAAAAEIAEWERTRPRLLTAADLLFGSPGRARWRVHHWHCDPRPGEPGDYTIDVERARTAADVLAWSVHLMAKVWLPGTDWPDFLRDRLQVRV